MAFRLCPIFVSSIAVITKPFIRNKSQRRTLGKPPGIARTLEQRLSELNCKDPNIFYKVDIGFRHNKKTRREVLSDHTAILKGNKSNVDLERLSRNNELIVSIDGVKEEWKKTVGPLHIKTAAEHYSVFEHLFGDAYFIPVVNLDISFPCNDLRIPVYRGNHINPSQAINTPDVSFKAPNNSLWTLVMTTPDGHFTSQYSEYVHWLVGNIKGGLINEGETIHKYLQPFPMKGAGYFRYIFVLYKQNQKIDYSSLMKHSDRVNLDERTFSTYDFYKEREGILTPAGLGFFQSDWDQSVTTFFHKMLGTSEPIYSYDFPKHYYREQEWFPLKRPFNLYLDRYRDEKKIAKEFIIKKLKKLHPFKKPESTLRFPNAVPFDKDTPSWLKLEMYKDRLKKGRVNDY